jgi:hypothetical protein
VVLAALLEHGLPRNVERPLDLLSLDEHTRRGACLQARILGLELEGDIEQP